MSDQIVSKQNISRRYDLPKDDSMDGAARIVVEGSIAVLQPEMGLNRN